MPAISNPSTLNKVPKLRFPGFSGEWEEKKLGEVCDYKNGGSFENNLIVNGKYNLITLNSIDIAGKLKNNHKTVDSADWYLKKDDMVMVLSDVAHGNFLGLVDIIPKDNKYVLNQRMGLLRKKDADVNLDFLRIYINNKQRYFKLHGQGSSQQNLSKGDILKFKILTPSLSEQQKIASFLGSTDEWIENLRTQKQSLESYKKGMMQKIFSQEFRFQDDNGKDFPKWEEKKLGEYLIHSSKRNTDNKVSLVLSVSNTRGFIAQSEQFEDHRVASKEVLNYKIVNRGDFAYNPSRINVGSIAVLKQYEVGIVSPMYVVFKLANKLDSVYFEHLIRTHRMKHLIKIGCSGSVRDSLNFDDMAKFKLQFPDIKEQQKIADFLTSIDSLLESKRQQIMQTEQWKRGLMQNMFV